MEKNRIMGTNSGGYTPPVGFHFRVEILGVGNNNDSRFQSVGGLTVEYGTETYKEGGENRFEHKMPGRTQYSANLTLKRGLLVDSNVINWFMDSFNARIIIPKTVIVTLLNENHQPLNTWKVAKAWPRKWSTSDFNAEENSLAIETLELNYAYFTVK